jgi:MFS transporter, DHA1 family, multidrug resistance protein
VLLFGLLMSITSLSVDLYLPSLPAVGKELSASAGAMQLTLSAFFAGLAAGQLFYGTLSDRFGRIVPLTVGLLLYVTASIACALATDVAALIVLRFVQALGACAAAVLARAIVRDLLTLESLGPTFSVLMFIMGVAPVLGPLASGYLISQGFGWSTIFWIHATTGAMCLLGVLTTLRESLPHERRLPALSLGHVARTYGAILRDRSFLAPALALSFVMAGIFVYAAASAHLFIEIHGVSAQAYAWIYAACAAGAMLASRVNRSLLRSIGLRHAMFAGLGINLSAAVALMAFAAFVLDGLPGLILTFFVLVASNGIVLPNATAAALMNQKERAGSAAALLGVAQFASGTLVGTLYATLVQVSAQSMATTILSCSFVAVAGYWLFTRPASRTFHVR